MVLRIFNDLAAWAIVAVIAVLAFVTALIFKNNLEKPDDTKSDDGHLSMGGAALIGLEAVILAVLGALIARAFISFLMGWANDSAAAGVAVGWGFFLVPGIVGTIPFLTHSNPLLTNVESLLTFATAIGGMSGAVNGLWRIYEWEGLGWIAFPLDVTWALAGNTVGCLLHVINFAWGDHSKEHRPNAHRYASGFGFGRYAFTQGCVMSNLDVASTGKLYHHEMTHVWQDRGFGPMYTLTYIGWLVVWTVPAVIAGVIKLGARGFGWGPMIWCYYNNPWEVWAYKVQDDTRESVVNDEDAAKLLWPDWLVILSSILYALAATFLAFLTVQFAWMNQSRPRPTSQSQQLEKKTKPPASQKPEHKDSAKSKPAGH